ncbi:hypothetical protein CSKR_114391 [Clonorchis sinensis]|uniref:Uncharacterized protein n=1 Tax=Clonorchis sinensis TaxID=79923 RepID=A0A3R7FWJ5_CLOSI|nr:hypothetical protein CSKR_114391 [Clonorchis sinensis]
MISRKIMIVAPIFLLILGVQSRPSNVENSTSEDVQDENVEQNLSADEDNADVATEGYENEDSAEQTDAADNDDSQPESQDTSSTDQSADDEDETDNVEGDSAENNADSESSAAVPQQSTKEESENESAENSEPAETESQNVTEEEASTENPEKFTATESEDSQTRQSEASIAAVAAGVERRVMATETTESNHGHTELSKQNSENTTTVPVVSTVNSTGPSLLAAAVYTQTKEALSTTEIRNDSSVKVVNKVSLESNLPAHNSTNHEVGEDTSTQDTEAAVVSPVSNNQENTETTTTEATTTIQSAATTPEPEVPHNGGTNETSEESPQILNENVKPVSFTENSEKMISLPSEIPSTSLAEPTKVSHIVTEASFTTEVEDSSLEQAGFKVVSFDLPIYNESLHRELLMNESDWVKELAAAEHPDEQSTIHDPCLYISENIQNVVGLNVTKEQIHNSLPTFQFLLEANTEELATIRDTLTACVNATAGKQEGSAPSCQQIRDLIKKTCETIKLCQGKESFIFTRSMERIRDVIETDQLADALLMIRACAGQTYE